MNAVIARAPSTERKGTERSKSLPFALFEAFFVELSILTSELEIDEWIVTVANKGAC